MGKGSEGPKETPEQKAFAQIAKAKWGDYQQNFKPAENKFMSKVDNMGSDKSFSQASRMGTNAVNSQFVSAINNDAKQMAAANVDANSGKAHARRSHLTREQEGAEIDTAARANAGQNERYVGGLKAVSAIGAGKEAEAIQGMGAVANNSAIYANGKAAVEMQKNQLGGELAGTAAGFATAHYTKPDGITYGEASHTPSNWVDNPINQNNSGVIHG